MTPNSSYNQSAHIRDVIKASPEPMSFGEIAAAAGVATLGLGTSLNRMVERGHLIRTGKLGSFRYQIGTGEIRYVRCQTEEERRERYLFCQQRRRDRRRLENGGRTLEQRRAEAAERKATKAIRVAENRAKREAAHALKLAEQEARRMRREAKEAARLEAQRKAEQRRLARLAPKPVPKPRALPRLDVAKSKPAPAPRPTYTSEDFIAAGGVIEILPGFQRIAPRNSINHSRGAA
ncbi:hypothetical protein [Pseudoxanthomonas sp. JBR18]|uniref:hypothetical protein n=1 Tax=Pseudoxanthomonas sp. JBR18 TaxID=2969308 RepID=UPI0023051862|nr:hypothetical protein [Pseudoxanthomonas sp. JBR18]WCE04471.1 hypothetical protein PJ250_00210 [Pseudoxanthomonas sp. JBR18]